MKKFLLPIIGCALITGTSTAAAPERAQFRMSATVKTICRATFSGDGVAMNEPGRLELGQFTQLCNSRAGFQIAMQHPAGLDGTILRLNGREIPLSGGTETIIADYAGPTFRTEQATLILDQDAQTPSTLSFRVIPKGPVY